MDMSVHPSPPSPGTGQRARWADLARDAAEANAFYAPDMLGAALDHLAGGGAVRLVEAYAGETLIGLMPVSIAGHHGRLPIACATNWMHHHAFFGAPMLRRGHEQAAWAAMLAQLDAASWAPHFLHLTGLDAAGANAAALEAVCATQGRARHEIHRYDRALLRSDLSADDYWESHVRAKKRKEIRRLQKRLADLGAVADRKLAARDELSGWCGEFLALERSGWKGREGTALACNPADAAFFRAACAAAFDAGRLHFLRLDLDGRAIAMLVNFRHQGGAFSFKIAFDEDLGRFSPGVLIELANLRHVQGDDGIGWMDSCAAPDHPMIDSLWAERRSIVQYRVALKGAGLTRLKRHAAMTLADGVDRLARLMKGQA
ncbi:CelD/BcsL family acetyltransferase involved in cellulose biosynthesis [Sphingobium fontiphilum]|uniref:CelD/BcsL family acetyltransferase involved in cellulose biosynthesis n=1 Tax=Sphingobium fontiphilum TaxID=944425 RepID=A0A7W6GQA8_9SPHN|nr:GNAT family N-acetyltransferase [Sphingobium fontiphilum]MBB3983402.1 CelD/BcsL family acetyltransferase involved in cellulose biosynthesis [Sphingobium fontiphilum]